MTPIYLNSSSNSNSPYPSDHQNEDQLCNHQFLSPNSHASSSSNSLTTHLFFNSAVHHHQNGIFCTELLPPQHQHKGDNYGSQVYNDDCVENNHEKDIKFSKWKSEINMNNDQTQVKWMSSKMRVMLKMKKSDPMKPSTFCSTSREVMNLKDHKLPSSPTDQETDNSSSSTSSNTNMPIRVCSICNTTKTPLWRSGPRGPKSLCNACGIRQRKARRALAAAAENGNTSASIDRSTMTPLKVTKIRRKDHKKTSNGHVTKYKKRQYSKQITGATMPSPATSPVPFPARKNCVEEFLLSLSKNLAFYRVFPQDEKEAAILLMALSCGYAHDQ